jgi:RNA polymerase sigma factor (sigma-70 family)
MPGFSLEGLSQRRLLRKAAAGDVRAFTRLYRELRRKRPEASRAEYEEELADASLVPSRALDHDEAARIVRELLADLPPITREIFALRYADGLRHGEIAKLLGLEEAAVKQRVSRVLRALRARGRALGIEGVGYAF